MFKVTSLNLTHFPRRSRLIHSTSAQIKHGLKASRRKIYVCLFGACKLRLFACGKRPTCFKAFCPRCLHYVIDSSAMMALSLKKPKEIKHPHWKPPMWPIHVLCSLPKYPPPNLPCSWCIAFLPPSLQLSH